MAQITKDSKIIFNKSGSGSKMGRITLPSDWLRALGIDEENREVEISFGYGNIIIKKKSKPSSL